jgi:hypothetical protein
MRFLFLIHGDEDAEAALSNGERRAIVEQHMAFAGALRKRGQLVLGDALLGSDAAAVVKPGRAPLVTDGPYSTTKEIIGGFYVVECETRDEALELAGRIPESPGAAVEVLQIADL